MTSESLYRVTTQPLGDSCLMYKAEASVQKIIDSFVKKYLDIDALWLIQNMASLRNYDGALWNIMDAFEEEYLIEDNDHLLMLLEEAWKSLTHYQERRVLRLKELPNEDEASTHESSDLLVGDVQRIIDSCELGMQRVSEYRSGNFQSPSEASEPSSPI